MKSITIHGLEKHLEDMIKSKAKAEGLSINKTIKKLLEEALGVKPKQMSSHRGDFLEFFGVWSEEEFEEFEKRTASLRKIDPEDWQ